MAEARGETPVAGQISDAREYRSHRRTSRARECGHFGAGLVLWLQELEELEASSVHAIMSDPAYIWEIQSDLVEIQLADRRRGHSNSVLRGQV